MSKDEKNKLQWEEPKTLWNVMFLVVFFASAALNLSQQMSNSLLSLYAKSLGTPAEQIGSLTSVWAITALLFRFVSGPAMNAFNRKRLLQGAMLLYVIAYFGFAFCEPISAATGISYVNVLRIFRVIQGVGQAFGNACLLTIVSDYIPKASFTSSMGIFACAQVIAQAIGPTAGVVLRDTVGYSMTFTISASLMAVTMILAAFLLKAAPREPTPFRLVPETMVAKEALVPAGITFLTAFGYTSINAFLLIYAEEHGIKGGSWFFTVYALTMFATRPIIGKLSDKFGFIKTGIPTVVLSAVSLVVVGLSTNLPMLLLAAFLNACGYGAAQPLLQSLCIQSVTPERRGSASGTYYIGLDSATVLGPYACGFIANKLGYTPVIWFAMAVPAALGVVWAFFFRGRINAIEADFKKRNAEAKEA